MSETKELLSQWKNGLSASVASLNHLAGETESEFLSFGSSLQGYYQKSSEITELANSLLSLVSGGDAGSLTERLQQMIGDMTNYIDRADKQSVDSCSTLKAVLSSLDTLSDPLENFQKMTKTLRMLGISTKIESARMGEAGLGFLTLALDVEKLSQQVNDKSSNILGHQQRLAVLIRGNLSKIEIAEKKQKNEVSKVLSEISNNLNQLVAMNDKCSELGINVSAISADVSNNISEIVSSLQMHDMTRQQVEHVVEAIEKANATITDIDADSIAESDLKKIVSEVGDVCELQSAQLKFAASELVNAVQVVIDNLKDVANEEGEIASQTFAVAGAADSSGSSFMSDMKKGMEVVVSVLSDCAKADVEMSQILSQVAGTLNEITGFVEDIEEVGTEINLIALNSQIKAAHTGTEGAALGVLAEAVKRLSVDAISQSDAVSKILNDINSSTDMLFSEANAETDDLNRLVSSMEIEISDILKSLSDMNEELAAVLAKLTKMVEKLNVDIDAAVSSVNVHKTANDISCEVQRTLDAIVESARKIEPASSEFKNNLKYMEQKYTMESERHIHEAIAKKRGGGAQSAIEKAKAAFAQQVSAAKKDDSEFGDNVDLF